jgi:hypothetical protein
MSRMRNCCPLPGVISRSSRRGTFPRRDCLTRPGIPLIPTDPRVETVANELIMRSLIPVKAQLDALHVAFAAVGGAQFLLTQNCRHIANAHTLPGIYRALEQLGYPGLLIYTPAEFLGDIDDASESHP